MGQRQQRRHHHAGQRENRARANAPEEQNDGFGTASALDVYLNSTAYWKNIPRPACDFTIDFRRFDQVFADIDVPRRQPAHQQQGAKKIDITLRRFCVHSQVARELGTIKHAALMLREHHPKATQGRGGDTRAELRNVALQVASYEVLPPAQVARIARRGEVVWETASQPEQV